MSNSTESWELLSEQLLLLNRNFDTAYVLLAASIVFFMQAGFAFLEAGSVRSKNTTNILFKNLLDTCVGCVAFWAFGFAFTGTGNEFIGSDCFFLIGCNDHIHYWFVLFVYSVTSVTIVSGAMAERTEVASYIMFSALCTGFLQPVVAHWAWSPDGWLAKGVENNQVSAVYKDFAGSSAVHVVGGTAAFMGAAIVGPRFGRFDESGMPVPIHPHTITMSALGLFILFFGFISFNLTAAMSLLADEEFEAIAGKIVFSVTMSGSAGGLGAVIAKKIIDRSQKRQWSLWSAMNGCLTGLVAICAGSDVVHPYAAVIIGAVAGLVYIIVVRLVVKARVDDPVDAVAVHLGGGCLGVIAVPFFDSTQGLFHHWNRKSMLLLGWNFCGLVTIVLWTAAISGIIFGTLYGFNMLRVSKEVELKGLDYYRHGDVASATDSYSSSATANRRGARSYTRRSTNDTLTDILGTFIRDSTMSRETVGSVSMSNISVAKTVDAVSSV
ncbi:putative ammonium transporter 1 [Corticium candelabrum]|uniref:putative ammonium transporter 1 n=1 Tax=Corticium candelabrum TaxID=121492 RepID=UPI002E266644|nr:putative ammonium transporter 1 [Corticium candelabrum]XP_062510768.1 putative ammonium transporter 1 [Corticium candelabrum]